MYIIFEVDDNLYGFDYQYIKKILSVKKIIKMPLTHPSIIGTTIIEEKIYTVVDMRHALFNKKSENNVNLGIAINYKDSYFLLLVDAIQELTEEVEVKPLSWKTGSFIDSALSLKHSEKEQTALCLSIPEFVKTL